MEDVYSPKSFRGSLPLMTSLKFVSKLFNSEFGLELLFPLDILRFSDMIAGY